MTNAISHNPEKYHGSRTRDLRIPAGKVNHCTRDASAYLWYILGTYSTSTTTSSYFQPYFHTTSTTCSKELPTLSMLLPVVTNYRQITLMDIWYAPKLCNYRSLRHNHALTYASSLVCLCQGSGSHVTASGSSTQPTDVLHAAGTSVHAGTLPHSGSFCTWTAVRIPIWPFRKYTSPSEWAYIA